MQDPPPARRVSLVAGIWSLDRPPVDGIFTVTGASGNEPSLTSQMGEISYFKFHNMAGLR